MAMWQTLIRSNMVDIDNLFFRPSYIVESYCPSCGYMVHSDVDIICPVCGSLIVVGV